MDVTSETVARHARAAWRAVMAAPAPSPELYDLADWLLGLAVAGGEHGDVLAGEDVEVLVAYRAVLRADRRRHDRKVCRELLAL